MLRRCSNVRNDFINALSTCSEVADTEFGKDWIFNPSPGEEYMEKKRRSFPSSSPMKTPDNLPAPLKKYSKSKRVFYCVYALMYSASPKSWKQRITSDIGRGAQINFRLSESFIVYPHRVTNPIPRMRCQIWLLHFPLLTHRNKETRLNNCVSHVYKPKSEGFFPI